MKQASPLLGPLTQLCVSCLLAAARRRRAPMRHLGLLWLEDGRLLEPRHLEPHHRRVLAKIPDRVGRLLRPQLYESQGQRPGAVRSGVPQGAQDCPPGGGVDGETPGWAVLAVALHCCPILD